MSTAPAENEYDLSKPIASINTDIKCAIYALAGSELAVLVSVILLVTNAAPTIPMIGCVVGTSFMFVLCAIYFCSLQFCICHLNRASEYDPYPRLAPPPPRQLQLVREHSLSSIQMDDEITNAP